MSVTSSANPQQNDSVLLSKSPSRTAAVAWIATAALAGAIVMAMELTAFRLYAPYFGNSIYVWGSMISVVMLALSVGYALGGWLADRATTDALLYWVIFGSGLYQLAIVFSSRTVMLKTWLWGDFAGTACATLVIFVPPMTALAMTSPYVIRMLARAGHVGVTVGTVFAWSTAGSIAGVLGTSFYLVPRFGTRVTMEILCAASIVIGLLGLLTKRRIAGLLALPLGLVFYAHAPVPPPTLIWNGDSAYNRILIFETGGLRYLVLNDSRFEQTIEKVGSANSGFYQDAFALGPVIVPAKKLLVLGMGAGRSIEVSRAAAPDLDVDAVEIDPQVVRLAGDFFELPKNDPRLRVHVADARPWLASHDVKSDIVHVDLFQGGPYVPFYLTTVEFFELVRSRMADDGVLIVNVYDLGKEHDLLNAIGATMAKVFPSLELMSEESGNNHLVFAFPKKRTHEDVVEKLKTAEGPAWVKELAQKAATEMVEFAPRAGAEIFTDDKTPVEKMTRRMLIQAGKI